MKLFLTLLSPLVFGAVTIDHQKASELLKREPRANEGLSEVRILFADAPDGNNIYPDVGNCGRIGKRMH